MLYWFHQTLGINLFQYITVRAGVAFFIGLLLTLFFMPRFIAWAQRSSRVQPINEYVSAHQGKAKTPTMGGIVFVVATVIASLLTVNVMNPFVIGGLLTLVFYAYIGFTGLLPLGTVPYTNQRPNLEYGYELFTKRNFLFDY